MNKNTLITIIVAAVIVIAVAVVVRMRSTPAESVTSQVTDAQNQTTSTSSQAGWPAVESSK